jgi:hypothetical protein
MATMSTGQGRKGHESRCRDQEFNSAQISELQRAIDENKWYLSERAGRDVGLREATDDFFRCHVDQFADSFRRRYCTQVCEHRHSCELSGCICRIPSSERIRHRVSNRHSRALERGGTHR